MDDNAILIATAIVTVSGLVGIVFGRINISNININIGNKTKHQKDNED